MKNRASHGGWVGRLAPLLVMLCGVLAYANSFRGVFLFDDLRNIRDNPHIGSFSRMLLSQGRPVLDTTFWLNHAVCKGAEVGYHLVNLLVHIGVALILFLLVQGSLRYRLQKTPAAATGRAWAQRVALAIACLWVVHPLTTGSVTYISQRAESLMSLFYVFVLYGFFRGVTGDSKLWLFLGVTACLLGMFTKEVMITAPVAVWLFDMLILGSAPREIWRRRKGWYIALGLTWVALALLMFVSAKMRPAEAYDWWGVSRGTYLLTQSRVIVKYLCLAFWPWPLCLDYQWPMAAGIAAVWPHLLVVAALLAAALAGVFSRKAWAFPAALFFLLLAPTSSIVPRPDPLFEHRVYLALACLVVLAVLAADRALAAAVSGRMRILFCVVGVAVLAATTHLRNYAYYSEIAMWSDVVRQRPDNLRARNDLASSLAAAGRIAEARAQFREVLDRLPPDIHARAKVGPVRTQGMVETSGPFYQYFTAQANLGLMSHKEAKNPRAAAGHYVLALRVLPWRTDVRMKLDRALADLGISLESFLNDSNLFPGSGAQAGPEE